MKYPRRVIETVLDATFVFTIGSFLLTIELLCLQICLRVC